MSAWDEDTADRFRKALRPSRTGGEEMDNKHNPLCMAVDGGPCNCGAEAGGGGEAKCKNCNGLGAIEAPDYWICCPVCDPDTSEKIVLRNKVAELERRLSDEITLRKRAEDEAKQGRLLAGGLENELHDALTGRDEARARAGKAIEWLRSIRSMAAGDAHGLRNNTTIYAICAATGKALDEVDGLGGGDVWVKAIPENRAQLEAMGVPFKDGTRDEDA